MANKWIAIFCGVSMLFLTALLYRMSLGATDEARQTEQQLIIVYTNDVRGEIEPCG